MSATRAIRLARPEDAPALASIYAPYVAKSAISFELEPPSADEMAARLRGSRAFAPWIVLEEDGDLTGYAYASHHNPRAAYRWSVNTTVYVRERARGAGVGRALYTSLFALLHVQGFFVAHAGITLPNPASVRLHEAFGFELVGVYRAVGYKLGAWHDVGWWRMALREASKEHEANERDAPREPLTTAELEAAGAFEVALRAGVASSE